jgi:hypothetical protein
MYGEAIESPAFVGKRIYPPRIEAFEIIAPAL